MAYEAFKKQLEARTLAFSVELLNFLCKLPQSRVFVVIVTQLAKSGTSMGANYREANRAETRADFTHKIGIVEKESSESVYWLTVLSKVNFLDASFEPEVLVLLKEASELLALFSTINRKSKA
jgi:four helix bundle protein